MKTRATFTIDKKLWTETQQMLTDLGYPDTTMSVYLSYQVEALLLRLEHAEPNFLDYLLHR